VEEMCTTLPPPAREASRSSGCASWLRWKQDSRLVAMIRVYSSPVHSTAGLKTTCAALFTYTYISPCMSSQLDQLVTRACDPWPRARAADSFASACACTALTRMSSLPPKTSLTVAMSASLSARTATSQTETVTCCSRPPPFSAHLRRHSSSSAALRRQLLHDRVPDPLAPAGDQRRRAGQDPSLAVALCCCHRPAGLYATETVCVVWFSLCTPRRDTKVSACPLAAHELATHSSSEPDEGLFG
jgi:hypothetical protein